MRVAAKLTERALFNVCESCGAYRADKDIDPAGPWAICPECGHPHPFLRQPFLCLTGASGTGKTAACLHLARTERDVVVLESDILWDPDRWSPDDEWRQYRNLWMRVWKNVGQAGKPVLLCGSANPGQFEPCVEARCFSGIHYLALVCDDAALESRLRRRPSWRGSAEPQAVRAHLDWNRWFKATRHSQDVTLLDTTHASVPETAEAVRRWMAARIGGQDR